MTTVKQMKVFKEIPESKFIVRVETISSLSMQRFDLDTRKVIVSTNIGETSITIPGVRHVIDCGRVKTKIFNPQTGLEVLQVQRISQAQAWQRSGRAGREAAGTCYRMYTGKPPIEARRRSIRFLSEEEFEQWPATPVPELLRCNLATAALQILAMGISNITTFDFLSKPDEKAIEAALRELMYLRAVQPSSSNGNTFELTNDGRKMACFPLDPK